MCSGLDGLLEAGSDSPQWRRVNLSDILRCMLDLIKFFAQPDPSEGSDRPDPPRLVKILFTRHNEYIQIINSANTRILLFNTVLYNRSRTPSGEDACAAQSAVPVSGGGALFAKETLL